MLQNLPLLVQRCCSRDTGIVLQAYYIIKNMDLKKCTVFFLRKITSEDKPNHLMDLEEAFLSLKERQSKISVYWVECKVSDTFWRMKFPHKMTLLEKEKPKIIWSGGTFCTDQMTTSLSLLVRKLISSDPVIFIAKT